MPSWTQAVLNGVERNAAPALGDLLRGLPVLIKLPVPRRALVWGLQDGVVEERIGHDRSDLTGNWPGHPWTACQTRSLRNCMTDFRPFGQCQDSLPRNIATTNSNHNANALQQSCVSFPHASSIPESAFTINPVFAACRGLAAAFTAFSPAASTLAWRDGGTLARELPAGAQPAGHYKAGMFAKLVVEK